MQDKLQQITATIEGIPVRKLKWNKIDNVIVGQVKCPIFGRDNLHEGFVVITWRSNGSVTPKFGGSTRKDLYLKIEL